MRPRNSVRRARRLLFLAGLAGALSIVGNWAHAVTMTAVEDVSPGAVKAESDKVSIFGIDMTTSSNPSLADTFTEARVQFNNVSGFSTSDLAADTAAADCSNDATSCDGVQLWRDTGKDDVLGTDDTAVSTGFTFDGNCEAPITVCTATFAMATQTLPTVSEGYTFIIAIRTSSTIGNDNTFNLTLPANAFTTSPTVHIPSGATQSQNIAGDISTPAAPTVSGLGLSTSVGKVRVGSTAVSAENPATLQVWRSSDGTCTGGLTFVTEGTQQNLTLTNRDLVGTTPAQTAALKSFPVNSQTVCYRVRDEAGNSSGFAADGLIPAAPATSDVGILGASNVTGVKRIISQPDPAVDTQGPRTFRIYIRPGSSSAELERAKNESLVSNNLVNVTTKLLAQSDSETTDIRQYTSGATIAPGDGLAYSRVNANGNDGPVTNDGVVPAAAPTSVLDILSASAVSDHQRISALADAGGPRQFALYVDPSGLTSWSPAVTSSGGSNTVVLQTSTSAATQTATTAIFGGTGGTVPLGSGHAIGYSLINGNGNQANVAADGTIPADPVSGNISASDALNQFRVNPFPVGVPPVAVKIRQFIGSGPSVAYLAGSNGEATSSTAVSVADYAPNTSVFYTAINTTTGNESNLVEDGSIPSQPSQDNLNVLRTSAADSHQRITAAAGGATGATFRLYLDPSGGTTWQRANTLSGGNGSNVEVTTAETPQSSGTTSIFAGNTPLGGGHAVSYARVQLSSGNDSEISAEGTIPAAPAASTLSVSDALNEMVATSATATNRIELHIGISGETAGTAYSESGPDASAVDANPVTIPDPDAASPLFYTATTPSSGNESTTTSDGTVPSTPSGASLSILSTSAAQGHQRLRSLADSSGPRTFRLYVDTSGGTGDTYRAFTSSGGTTAVEVATNSTQPTSSPTTQIFSGIDRTTALDDGDAVLYAEVSAAGNDSDAAAGGTIPAAPAKTSVRASAATDEVFSTASSATFNVAVFKSTSTSESVAYSEGVDVTLDADQTKPLDTSSGDRLFYQRIETSTNNESSLIEDGAIPTKVDSAVSSASDARQEIVAAGADPGTPIDVFFHATNEASAAYNAGADYTMTSSPFIAGSDLPAQFLFFVRRDVVSANESEIVADGSIPPSPADASEALFASAATQKIEANPDSTGRTLRLYGDPDGAVDWERATTTAEGGTFVEFTTSTGGQTESGVGLFLGGAPLGTGATVAYSRLLAGNESDLVTDGSIPAPPTGTGNFSASAADQSATVASAADPGIYRLFRGSTPASGRTVHAGGSSTPIVASGLVAGDAVGYAQSNVSGNESTILADGSIPATPTHTLRDESDTGLSQDDGITQDTEPTFDLTGIAGATAQLYEGEFPRGTGTFDVNGTLTLTTPALTAGAHDIQSKQTVDGNTSPAAPVLTVTVDTTTPTTPSAPDLTSDTGLSSTDNITKTDQPELSLNTEAGAQVKLFEDLETDVLLDTVLANGSGLASLVSDHLADGDHTLYAIVTDPAGNQTPNGGTLTITIDTVAPTELGGSPDLQAGSDSGITTDNITNDATPTFDINGADPGVLVGLLDGLTTIATGTTDETGSVTLTAPSALSEGAHSIRSSAQDTAGNFGPLSPSLALTVDTVAPTAATPDLAAASDHGRSSTDDLTNDATPSVLVASEPGAVVEVFEGATGVGSTTAGGGGVATVTTSSLGDGAHTLTAKATDVAGNASTISSGLVVTIDTGVPTAPGVPDLQAGSDTGASSTDNITSDNTPTFDVSFAESNALVTLKAGAATLGTEIGTATVAITTGELTDGARTVTATATDVAGNESPASDGLSVTIDAVAPTAPAAPDLTAGSDSGISSSDNVTSDTTPTLSLSGPETNLTFELFKGETSLGTVAAGNSTSAAITVTLTEGVHSLFAKVTDQSGKVSADGPSLTITIDTTAPTAVITVPTALSGLGSVQFSEHVTPVGPSNVVIRADGSSTNVPAAVSYNATNFVATIRPTSPLVAAADYILIVAPGGSAAQNDVAGNVIESSSAEFTTPLVAEETDAALVQSWRNVKASSAYGGYYRYERTKGASVKRTFTGTSVTWYSLKNPYAGKAEVFIDGVSKGTTDLYSTTTVYRFAKSFTGLGAGSHTIEVRVLGTKRSTAKDRRVAFDAFKVGAESPTANGVTYAWGRVLNAGASGGGYMRSDLVGASVTFRFTGTSVDWYTVTGSSMGKAYVYIDGVLVQTVDNYSATTAFGVVRSVVGLSDATHTLKIVTVGAKHTSSSGTMVAVDKIQVPA